jgi:hypothetical protein
LLHFADLVYAQEIRTSVNLKEFIRQPLLHFLLIGGLLFAIYYAVRPAMEGKDTIVIDDDQVSRIVELFEKEWNRPPTEAEMKGLLERHIQQEVYYRKALLMNLDHNDEIIRRRLDQKLRFITNDMANLKQPTEQELSDYVKHHADKYRRPATYSFSHIYFSPDKRQHPDLDALNALPGLPVSDADPSGWLKRGDAFPFAFHVDSLSVKDVASQMGEEFAHGLTGLPLHKWSGPLTSGYGVHLIYVDKVWTSADPDMAQIREEVLRDYQYDLQQQYNDQLYKDFRKDFTIKMNISDPKKSAELSQLIAADVKK